MMLSSAVVAFTFVIGMFCIIFSTAVESHSERDMLENDEVSYISSNQHTVDEGVGGGLACIKEARIEFHYGFGYIYSPVCSHNVVDHSWHIESKLANYTLTLQKDFVFKLAYQDTLLVYDGPSGNSPLIANFTNGAEFHTRHSSGADLFIRYLSNSYDPSQTSFKLRYAHYVRFRSVHLFAGPEYEFITSPGFPSPYLPDLDYKWYIYPRTLESIELTMLECEIETYDFLTVIVDSHSVDLAPFSVNSFPMTFTGIIDVRVYFKTNYAMALKGFKAKYRSIPLPDDHTWTSTCQYQSYQSKENGISWLYDNLLGAHCVFLPPVNDTSAYKFQIESSDIPNGTTILTINSIKNGVLATLSDFDGFSNYDLGTYQDPNLFIRLLKAVVREDLGFASVNVRYDAVVQELL
ncbi:unnamed protein product [Clavelina lepadiformis]|uniref:CUB domain-containing protein n=1 Tax=Clavelina lepadiformis TaxID=159417 RepID=A0ABP0G1E4_CLALP